MATKPRPWPNNADAIRMDCISISRKGQAVLLAELERVNDPGLLRSIARAVEAFREIEAKLIACRNEENGKE